MTDEAMKSKDRRRDQVKIAKATLDEMKSRIKDYEKEVQQLRKKKTPAKTS
jgi:prefoldin subunit 5